MKRAQWLVVAVLGGGLLVAGYAFAGAPGGKNLKVLPGTMSKTDVKKAMKGISDALGVQCDHCHDTEDMAKDTEHKDKAREMMRMTAEINRSFFKGKEKVSCMTCHRGKHAP